MRVEGSQGEEVVGEIVEEQRQLPAQNPHA